MTVGKFFTRRNDMGNEELEKKVLELEKQLVDLRELFEKFSEENKILMNELIDLKRENNDTLISKYRSNDFLMKENEKYARSFEDVFISQSNEIELMRNKINDLEKEIKDSKSVYLDGEKYYKV